MDANARKGMIFHLCLEDILIFTKRRKVDRIEATKEGVVPVNNKEHSPQELARWLEETWGAQPVDYGESGRISPPHPGEKQFFRRKESRAPFWPIVSPRESKASLFMKRSGTQCRWR